MMKEFVDTAESSAHDRFQVWRTKNQDDVFLTMETRTRANFHGARCLHLGSGPPYFSSEAGLGSLTTKRKLCAPEPELLAWAAGNGVTVHRCSHCVRDGFIPSDATTPAVYPVQLDGSEFSEELVGLEGAARIRMTVHRRRESKLREAKIADALRRGRLCCEVPGCNFDFEATYGALGQGYAQVHHLQPLSEREEDAPTRLADLAVVCANCHVMIHRGGQNRAIERLVTKSTLR